MRSPIGVLGAAVMLSALPLAILCDMFFPAVASALVHILFGAGMAMITLAVFDFRTPDWARWAGLAGAGGLAVVFALQGVSDLVGNSSLVYVAYGLFGQGLESGLAYLAVAWWLGVLLSDEEGWTKTLGFILIVVFLLAELYANVSKTLDMTPSEYLKLAKLLPFVWLIAAGAERARPISARIV